MARAASVTGQALLLNGGGAPLLLTAGYILSPGDRIDTRGGGRVVIDLSDGSMVVVAPESVVALKDYRMAGSLRELFEITFGAVRVKINHFAGKPNPYRMNSPTASIAVRGTEFTVSVAASGETEVDVIEGLVEVTSRSDPSRSVLLEAGRGAIVPVGQGPRLVGALQPLGGRDAGDRDGGPQHPEQAAAPAAQRNAPGNASPQQGVNLPGQPAAPPAYQPQPGNQPPKGQDPGPQRAPAPMPQANAGHDKDDGSPRATASTYDRYLAGLADIGQEPFLLRYNAFAESHLDSLENPAYATQFRQPEGRLLYLPTYRGTRTLEEYQQAFGPAGTLPGGYSVSPQLSYFTPAGAWTLGGAASFSRVGENASSGAGSATSNYYSGSLVAAWRAGRNSLGGEFSRLRGSGSINPYGDDYLGGSSRVTQSRFTLGYARDLGATTTLGVFYRYAFIDAADRSTVRLGDEGNAANGIVTGGHSSEGGIRLRGALTRRLYYGATAAWLGISLSDALAQAGMPSAHSRGRAERGSLAAGLGYSLTPRTILTLDFAGGVGRTWSSHSADFNGVTLQNAADHSRFLSVHAAVQRDLSRHLFVSASLLQLCQSHSYRVSLFPGGWDDAVAAPDALFSSTPISTYAAHFSDYGAGWRFSRNLSVQYLFSTDYGVTSATHAILLRWTFHPRGE